MYCRAAYDTVVLSSPHTNLLNYINIIIIMKVLNFSLLSCISVVYKIKYLQYITC